MRQVTGILSVTAFGLASANATAESFLSSEIPRAQVLLLFGISGILLLALWALLRRINQVKQRLDARTDQLVDEQDQRVRAEVLLKQAKGSVEQQVKERTAKLEKTNEDLMESTNRMKQLVAFDELTQLPNETQFASIVDIELSRALREGKPISLLLFQIDFFENYLESYGKERADSTVKTIAESAQKIFRRAGDSVARHDEDTFAVVFPADSAASLRFAERLQKAIWQIPIPHDSSEVADRVTVSIGLVTIPPTRIFSTSEGLELARRGLSKAKKQGGNQFIQQPPEAASAQSPSTA